MCCNILQHGLRSYIHNISEVSGHGRWAGRGRWVTAPGSLDRDDRDNHFDHLWFMKCQKALWRRVSLKCRSDGYSSSALRKERGPLGIGKRLAWRGHGWSTLLFQAFVSRYVNHMCEMNWNDHWMSRWPPKPVLSGRQLVTSHYPTAGNRFWFRHSLAISDKPAECKTDQNSNLQSSSVAKAQARIETLQFELQSVQAGTLKNLYIDFLCDRPQDSNNSVDSARFITCQDLIAPTFSRLEQQKRYTN